MGILIACLVEINNILYFVCEVVKVVFYVYGHSKYHENDYWHLRSMAYKIVSLPLKP